MSRRFRQLSIHILAAGLLAGIGTGPARAQETVATNLPDSEHGTADELLGRPVTVNVTRVSLKSAIDAIATSAKIVIQYRTHVIEAYTTPVTLQVSNMPLKMALDRVLTDTKLAVVLANGAKSLTIVENETGVAAEGGIAGRVTNAKTKQVVAGATVTIDDSVRSTTTDAMGHYRFAGLSAGTHSVRIRALGYARQSRVVSVTDDAVQTVDFALEGTVNTLDQVVVTATGEQLYRQLGHEVTHLNADSLVKNAPITNVAELLTARVPGLQVMTSDGGVAGGEFAIQIRGQTTTSLDPQPIVIVDGIRYKNTNGVVSSSAGFRDGISEDVRPFGAEERSPLNDLNVNDIESVEVVKGPSASTLYGPDAANGVIVITTKRARAGKTEWHVYAHPRLNDITNDGLGNQVPRGYWAWGHDPNTLQTVTFSCDLQRVYFKQCVQDSITIAPLYASQPDFNVITQNRPQWQYGANVSGGTEMLRYFLSGGYDTQVGSLRIPPEAAKLLEQQFGTSTLSSAIRDPNTQQTMSLHSDLDVTPNTKATLRLSAIYSQTSQRSVTTGMYGDDLSEGVAQPGCAQSSNPTTCSPIGSYDSFFLNTTEEQAQRIDGSINGTLQAASWLNLNGTVGVDLDGTVDRGVRPAGSDYPGDGGEVSDERRNNTNRTAKLNAVAQFHPGVFSFRTTLGVHYDYTHLDGINSDGQNLAPGSLSITTATYQSNQQLWAEEVSLGGYGEEVLGLDNRLFLTGGLRLDGSTSYGDAYHARPFPNVGVSWIASDEPFLRNMPGLQELRFRFSYGASSRYPTSNMKLGSIGANANYVEGIQQNEYSRNTLANPDLRPERSREAEYGTDITLFRGILVGKLTWHRNRTDDQLQDVYNPTGLRSQWQNVGDVASSGFEMTVDAHLLDTKVAQGNLTFIYSSQHDKLVNLGAATPNQCCAGVFRVGYPLGAVFGNPVIGYVDTVGGHADGIILRQEVVTSPTLQYLGVQVPPKTYALTPQLTFLQGRLRFSTTIDRQTGFVVQDISQTTSGLTLAGLAPESPPLAQAIYVYGQPPYVPGDFTRWREFTVGTDIPQRLLRLALMSRGSINFQVRNLALWSRYHASDPEVMPGLGTMAVESSSGTPGIPLARVWTISFDVTP